MTIRWPKPYTEALTRDQIRLIMRIYLLDLYARRYNGYSQCTHGLKPRLAAEFGVKLKLIDDIIDTLKTKRPNRRRFRDINTHLERSNALREWKRRCRQYGNPTARPEQDPAGT